MSSKDSSVWSSASRIDALSHPSFSEADSLSTRILRANGRVKILNSANGRLHWPHVPGYEILSEIGAGAMGVVYKARHIDLNRTVAVKMLRGMAHSDPQFRERFKAEAAAVAKLQHPNIIQVFEIGTSAIMPGEMDPSLFISLEYVGGGSLAQFVGRPQSPRHAAAIVEKLARATYYAHQSGVIHRDLKPSNVLIGLDEEPKIADFGVAKQLGDDEDSPGRFHTMAGTLIGTPEYMAPEQVAGASPTGSIDIYALGVILYELLTARVPFQGASSVETIDLVRQQEPVTPSSLHRDLPADMETICLKCLEKHPLHRYATALDLAEDLRRFQEDRPIRARPIGELERCRRWCRRNPALAATSTGTVAVFLIAFLLVTSSYLRTENALQEEASQRRIAERNATSERWERYRADLRATAAAIQVHDVSGARRTLDAAPEGHRNWEWKHFSARLDSSQHVLSICEPLASRVDMSLNASRMLFIAPEGSASIWSLLNLQKVRDFTKDELTWNSSLSPDGRTLVWSCKDNSIVVLDIESNSVRAVLRGHHQRVHTMRFTADSGRLLTCADDNNLCAWDVASGQLLAKPNSFADKIRGLGISPDGRFAALIWTNNADPLIWDIDRGVAVAKLAAQSDLIGSVNFNMSGDRIVTVGSYPNVIVRLWDSSDGKLLNSSRVHTNGIASIDISADGTRFATGSLDQTIGLWDGVSGQLLATLRGHNGWVNCLAFSPDGKRLVSGSQDRTLRLWDAATGDPLAILNGHTGEVSRVAFSADGRKIISNALDGTARIWDAELMEYNGVLRGHTAFVYNVAIHPDGERAASSGWDGTVRLWNMTTGRQLLTLDHGEKKIVGSVAFHPNGQLLASRDREAVHLWDLATGREIHRFNVPSDWWRDTRLAFSPDGGLLAAGCANREIRLWDVNRQTEIGVLRGHIDQIRDVTFSPDGRWLASAGDRDDRTVRIWDVERLTEVRKLVGHSDGVYAVAFNPSGTLLASGAVDGDIRLWDTTTWEAVADLKLGSNVYGVAFTPDGTRVVGACADNVIRFWDTAMHQEVAELRGHDAYVHSIAFSPDGTRLASASGDLTVRIWDTMRTHDRMALHQTITQLKKSDASAAIRAAAVED